MAKAYEVTSCKMCPMMRVHLGGWCSCVVNPALRWRNLGEYSLKTHQDCPLPDMPKKEGEPISKMETTTEANQ